MQELREAIDAILNLKSLLRSSEAVSIFDGTHKDFDPYHDALDNVINLIVDALCKMNCDRWVSVKTRMPETKDGHSDFVLVITDMYTQPMVRIALVTDEGQWRDFGGCDVENVTHWMPTPDLPR